MHNLVGGLPHHILRDLAAKYGPLMHLRLGEVPVVVISSPDMAKEILVSRDPAFAARPHTLASKIIWYDHQDLIFAPYSDYWSQMRKICMMDFFSEKKVRSFTFIFQDEISQLTNSIRSSEGVAINLTDKIFAHVSSMICRAAFGRVYKDQETTIQNLKTAIAFAAGINVADFFPSLKLLHAITGLKHKLQKMHDYLDEVLENVIKQHKANHASGKMGNAESGDGDLIDVLLQQQESGKYQIPIKAENIKGVLLDIFAAGLDASSVIIEWAMSELMRHPGILTKAQEELRRVCKGKKTIDEDDIQNLKYFKMVVKETLRLHPAAAFIPRATAENCEVNGYIIPEKARVLINIWAIGRDPKNWDDPENFMPERFEQKSVDYLGTHCGYIPFGSGRRLCPGSTLGLATVELMLAHLLYHFDWKLPDEMNPKDLDMDEVFGIGSTLGLATVELMLAHLLYHFDWKLPDEMNPKDLDMDEVFGIGIARKNALCLVAKAYDPFQDQ
nr:premnaspirodiene oxygenase-like [Coffea arabica]